MVIDKRNIQDFAVGGFRPHGEVELWAEGPVMRVIAQGPFNREAVRALGKAVNDLYQALGPDRPICELIEYRHSLLASPETLTTLGDLLALMTRLGIAQKAIAIVVTDDVEARDLMLPIVTKVYTDQGRAVASFSSVAEAQAWLTQQLGR